MAQIRSVYGHQEGGAGGARNAQFTAIHDALPVMILEPYWGLEMPNWQSLPSHLGPQLGKLNKVRCSCTAQMRSKTSIDISSYNICNSPDINNPFPTLSPPRHEYSSTNTESDYDPYSISSQLHIHDNHASLIFDALSRL